jgi:cytochrome P450
VSRYVDTILDCTAETSKPWNGKTTINCLDEMMRLTFSIISRILFSRTDEDELETIRNGMEAGRTIFSRALNPLGALLDILPLPGTFKLHNAKINFDKVVYKIIQRSISEKSSNEDFLSLLLSSDHQLSIQEIRDEILTLLLSGHETTALGLTWALYLLSQHPDVEHRLSCELQTVLDGRRPTLNDIPKLQYSKSVIQEVLRLYPPVYAFGREAIRESKIGEYTVPVGAVVYVSPYVLHRDGRFFERPEEFDPGRWSSPSPSERTKFAYFPFGAGPRGCIGESLAWLEMTLVIVELAQEWKFELHDQMTPSVDPLITLRPRGQITMQIRKKSVGEAAPSISER